MKKILFFAMVAIMFSGCAKKAQEAYKGEVDVEIPCSEDKYKSDAKVFRALGEGYSTDMTIARNKALTTARAELATQIGATIKRVTDNYASSYQTGIQEEAKSRFQDLTRVVVEQRLQGTRVVCEKAKRTKDNKFRIYVVVELSSDDLATDILNKVSSDDKLRTDYEYEKFKKVFEEEMKKL